MALEFETENENKAPALPDPVGHEANDLARRFFDARTSRERREAKYRRKQNHPAHRKIREAVESRMIYFYAFAAMFLVPTLYWEWEVSREIYQVRFSTWPIIPYMVFIGLAFTAGTLFAEATPMFSIFPGGQGEPENPAKRVVENLYDRPTPGWRPGKRALCLMGAIFITLLVLIPIYFFSQERVMFLKQAGELNENFSRTDLWLPVMLYGLEILLGMPASFIGIAFIHYLSLKSEGRNLTREMDLEQELRKLTIDTYYQYVNALDEYNRAAGNGTRERFLIPPNTALRDLLVNEFGYDPTRSQGPETDQPSYVGKASPPGGTEPPNPRQRTGQEEPGAERRVEDLLNIVDQQIDGKNRNL